MHAMRLTSLSVTIALIACADATLPVRIGISHEGGAGQHTLAFVVQPAGAVAGDIITPSIQVAARDSLGNTDRAFAANVTIVLGANPSGAFLSGTRTVPAVFGVANFGDLSINKPGTYTLLATAPGAAAAASGGFAIVNEP
jgi:hypothetical protein